MGEPTRRKQATLRLHNRMSRFTWRCRAGPPFFATGDSATAYKHCIISSPNCLGRGAPVDAWHRVVSQTDFNDSPLHIVSMELQAVCGMKVEIVTAGHSASRANRVYYFYSARCKRSFETEPEKSVAGAVYRLAYGDNCRRASHATRPIEENNNAL